MKKIILLPVFFLFLIACNNKKEQKNNTVIKIPTTDSATRIRPERAANPYAPVDVSPMDMSYFPVDYPKIKMSNSSIAAPLARVVYSRPHLQGRNLFKDVLKYGEPWRLGANESTELDLYADATIQDKKIKAGRYVLYCIPEEDKWTIIFNSNIDSWGLHQDDTKDVARFTIPSKQINASIEFFTIVFEKETNNAALVMAWGNVEARLPITF